MFELTGDVDLKKIACDHEELEKYLLFDDKNADSVSRELCQISDTQIGDITDYIQSQIDVAKIIQFVSIDNKCLMMLR